MKDFIASQTALGRVGVSDDIGGVVAFLCSEEGRWVNAQRLEASGGMFFVKRIPSGISPLYDAEKR